MMVCLRECVPEIKREETRRTTMSTIHSGDTRGYDNTLPILKHSPIQLVSEAQTIAEYLARKRGLTFSSDQILVAPGSKPLLYALMQILEGDLLLPVPSWVSYAPHARLAGRRVIGVETDSVDCHC